MRTYGRTGNQYTTFARIAGHEEGIPGDRIADDTDRTALFVNGDGRSSR